MTAQSGDLRVEVGVALVRRQVEDHLRRAILQGRFRPGDHLSDRELQDLFQVSRTVVREAVRRLEAEGLVETLPHRGTFVKALSAEEAEHLYAVRGVLEGLAAREFTRRASPEQIDALDAVLHRLRANLASVASHDLVVLKQEFYDVMLAGCGNGYVQKLLRQLLNRITMLRAMSLSEPARLSQTVAELEALLAAIRARDEDAAWTASLVHVRNAGEVALRLLRHRRPASGLDDGAAPGGSD